MQPLVPGNPYGEIYTEQPGRGYVTPAPYQTPHMFIPSQTSQVQVVNTFTILHLCNWLLVVKMPLVTRDIQGSVSFDFYMFSGRINILHLLFPLSLLWPLILRLLLLWQMWINISSQHWVLSCILSVDLHLISI